MNARVKPSTVDSLKRVRTTVDGVSAKIRTNLPQWLKDNQASVIVAGAFLLAMLALLIFWSGTGNRNLRPLYGRQETYDVSAVMERLDAQRIDYQLHPDSGQVLVPVDELGRARMALATAGITRQLPTGMEVLSTEGQLGRSQFVERAQYLQGLQGEIEQTIISLHSVRSARVHIAAPERTAFLREQLSPSASVFLDLFPGAVLDQKQVQGIINLVAGSYPSLSPEDITVVDQNSNLLTGIDRSGFEETDKKLEYTQRLEREYVQRISRLLEPLVGNGNLRVAANVDIDFSYLEESTEGFVPESAVIRSESFTGSSRDDQASGVPGVAANAGGESIEEESGRSISQVRNYEVDRTVSYRRQDGFQVSRVNIAVVLNSDIDGFSGEQAEARLASIENLLLNAAGINVARGDQVAVQAMPFIRELNAGSVEDLLLGTDSGRNSMIIAIVALLSLMICAALVFVWLRKRQELKQKELMANEIAMLAGRDDIESGSDDSSHGDFRNADRVRDLAKSSPDQVAGILERWIKEGDR